MHSDYTVYGRLTTKVLRAKRAPLSWRLRNTLRWGYITGWLYNGLAKVFSRWTGIVTLTSTLYVRVRRASGEWVNYGAVCFKKVTKVGVTYLVDDWVGGASDISAMKYHGCGTDSTAEANTQTALIAECTAILNPDNTRATGTQTKVGGDNNILQSVGTVLFDGGGTITEHGLLSQAATGGGTLWDRHIFTGIGVGSGDSIQFTYQVTCNYEA